MMKKIFYILSLLIILSCGNAQAADITLVIPHGHSNNSDGGVLTTNSTVIGLVSSLGITSPTSTFLNFDKVVYDSLSTRTTSSYITIPSGYNFFKVNCQFSITATIAGTLIQFTIAKNELAASNFAYPIITYYPFRAGEETRSFNSPMFPVSPNDRIEIFSSITGNNGTVVGLTQGRTWCSFDFYR